MDQAIYSATSGAMAMEVKLATIANNLANVNTTGFKRDEVSFEKYMRQLDTTPLASLEHKRIAEDVTTKNHWIDTSQGPNRQTGNPLDVALNGEGFFVVNTPDGERYTRCGSFQRSIDGQLVDLEGNPVQGEGGEIEIGQGEVLIGTDGTITVGGEIVDQLKVVTIDPDGLSKQGKNYFDIKDGFTASTPETITIQQGAIENSNVNAIQEMLGLIETQRAYEAFQKMIRSTNETYGQTIRNVGTTS